MGSTYLELTNKLLRRLGEVELTDTSFTSTRNLHSHAKDAINDSIREISQQRWEWPFHAMEHTLVFSKGENEYDWPTSFKSVDWESFQIQRDDALSVRSKNLRQIDKDEWYRHFKQEDDDSGSDGVGVPSFVFRTHGVGFGVTPAPNEAYTIKFRYYKTPTLLTLYSDQTDIPSEYDNVIIAGALMHMNLFKENAQGFSLMKQEFKDGIKNMYNSLVGYIESMADTRSAYSQVPLLTKSEGYKL